jgi:energy-coupling factor transporter ATP-binding protein EcfA2
MFTLFQQPNTSGSSNQDREIKIKEQTDQFFLAIQNSTDKTKKAKDKEIVVFLGKTGVGKSTAINYLLGCKMQREKIEGKRFGIGVVGKNEIAKIGHSSIISETLNAELYESVDGSGLIFCDTGGFMDSRGAEMDIINAITISMTLNSAVGVKIILCIEYAELMSSRGALVIETLRQIDALYNYHKHPNSIIFLITKAYAEGEVLTTRFVREDILLLAKEANDSNKVFFDRMAKNKGANVHVCDPLGSEKLRSDLLGAIYQLDSIPTEDRPFTVTYSPSAYQQLTYLLTTIAQSGIQLYTNLQESCDRLLTLQTRAKELRQQYDICLEREGEVKAITDKITSLGNTIASQQSNLPTLSSKIKSLTEKAVFEQSNAYQIQRRIDSLQSQPEVTLWSDSFNRSAISRRVPYTYTETETTYKEIYRDLYAQTYWGQLMPVGRVKVGELPFDTKVQKTGYRDESDTLPSKEFSYSGSLISRVSKSPSYSSNWVNEYQSSYSYTVTYRPNKGESASASVTVYGQYQYTAEGSSRISNERQQFNTAEQRCRQFTEERFSSEKTLATLQNEIEKNNRTLARLCESKIELQDKYVEMEAWTAACETENTKNIGFQKDILWEYERLNFLNRFLTLSQDTLLLRNEVIQQFIQLSVQYEKTNTRIIPGHEISSNIAQVEETFQKKLVL